MEAVNIRYVGGESNYRLLNEPVLLRTRIERVPTMDEFRWEDDGGLATELVYEDTTKEYNRQKMRVRGTKKQQAARLSRPVESMRIIKVNKPAPVEVVNVRLRGGSEQDERVAELEARIKELLGIVRGRQ